MKKSTKIIIIISIIVSVIVIIGTVLFLSLSKDKDAITPETFKNTMEQKGYNVVNVKNSQFSAVKEINQAYVAQDKERKYQIEFYETIDDASANVFFNNNKNIIESSKGNVSSGKTVNMRNYAKYTLNSNGKYATLSKIDNTVIYLVVDDIYEDTVKELLKEIGY